MEATIDPELQSLMDAHKMLDGKRHELCSGPQAIFAIVFHAMRHVDGMIDAHIRGAQ